MIHINKKIIFLLILNLIWFVFPSFSFKIVNKQGHLSEVQISNLYAFAKVYGILKYFHPSTGTSKIDWDKFAIYGSKKVIDLEDGSELKSELIDLFSPIAPSLRIIHDNIEYPESMGSIDFPLKYWHHQGLSLFQNAGSKSYISKIINENNLTDNHNLPPKYHIEKLGDNLKCIIPLSLNTLKDEALTSNNLENLDSLINEINKIEKGELSGNISEVRVGNIINIWNVYNHFFPYRDILDLNWDNLLKHFIQKSFIDMTESEYLFLLRSFVSKTGDGHGNVTLDSYKDYFVPSIDWQIIEGKLVITDFFYPAKGLKKGDIVKKINDIPTEVYLKKFEKYVSAITTGRKSYNLTRLALMGTKNSQLKIELLSSEDNIKSILLNRTTTLHGLSLKEVPIIESFKEDILYINLNKTTYSFLKMNIDKLMDYKVIICDLRKRPGNNNYKLISHLLDFPDTINDWMLIPEFLYPDQKNIASYKKMGWELKPEKPKIQSKFYFIIGPETISYGESLLGFIDYYNLGTIVGSTSAGTNGSVNSFYLPGGYKIFWTGMIVNKFDGRLLYGKGFQPHIIIDDSIEDIRLGRDGVLYHTITLAEKFLRENLKDYD